MSINRFPPLEICDHLARLNLPPSPSTTTDETSDVSSSELDSSLLETISNSSNQSIARYYPLDGRAESGPGAVS